MRKRVILTLFVVASCLISAPEPAWAKMTCYPGGVIRTSDGYYACSVFEDNGDCEWCEVVVCN